MKKKVMTVLLLHMEQVTTNQKHSTRNMPDSPFRRSRGRGAIKGSEWGASNCELRPGAIFSQTW
jgi:hypothetical protein